MARCGVLLVSLRWASTTWRSPSWRTSASNWRAAALLRCPVRPAIRCLRGPGVRSLGQHARVVVGLQNQGLAAGQMRTNHGRRHPQVGGQAELDAVGSHREAGRVGGVMGQRKGVDGQPIDAKAAPGLEVHHAVDAPQVGGGAGLGAP